MCLPHGSLVKLLLLGFADDWRLLGEDLLQIAQKLCYTRSVPSLLPVPQIRVIYFAIHSDMLTRPNKHVPSRRKVHDGRLLRVRLRHP